MNSSGLSRLENVDPRDVWITEDRDFTPWLAQEENLTLLADTIGLDLELESTEKNVGPFRADILCKDTVTDNWVLIENQLERTDHRHLGQLMTYAAGLNAVTIVWIADQFTEEHRAALDWLNEITDEDINFFGLEIELWRIADSPIAPKFNVVSKPNDWTKSVHTSRQLASGEITETKQLHLEYWTIFNDLLRTSKSVIQPRKPRPQHWQNYAVGRTGFRLMASTGMRDGYISVQLAMTDDLAKPHFFLLLDQKTEIEAEFGEELNWRELPNNKQSDVMLLRDNVDPTDKDRWSEYHIWLKEKLEKLYQVFSPRISRLNTDDFIPPVDEDFDVE